MHIDEGCPAYKQENLVECTTNEQSPFAGDVQEIFNRRIADDASNNLHNATIGQAGTESLQTDAYKVGEAAFATWQEPGSKYSVAKEKCVLGYYRAIQDICKVQAGEKFRIEGWMQVDGVDADESRWMQFGIWTPADPAGPDAAEYVPECDAVFDGTEWIQPFSC